MDIISLMMAKKVDKRMSTEFSGVNELITIDTHGLQVVNTTKEMTSDINNLEVIINGFFIDNLYYTLSMNPNKTLKITFKEGLNAGDEVYVRTKVAGIPKYNITNPPYNDTDIKASITAIEQSLGLAEKDITSIKTLLDDDADGDILDFIVNLKAQWQDADSNLVSLINDKVSASTFNTANQKLLNLENEIVAARDNSSNLKEKLDAIISSIPKEYNDIELKNRIKSVEDAILKLTGIQKQIQLVDESTNWVYNVKVKNGIIIPELIKYLNSLSFDYVKNPIKVGEQTSLTFDAKYQDNSTAEGYTLTYTIANPALVSINEITHTITALSHGSTNITVTATLGEISKSATKSIVIDKSDAQKVAESKSDLTLGDTSSVISNITLPTTQGECNITWMSDNASIIDNSGVVVRPTNGSGNATVQLIATISYGEVNDTKTFTITVLEQEASVEGQV